VKSRPRSGFATVGGLGAPDSNTIAMPGGD
jgi:hypothetical protein